MSGLRICDTTTSWLTQRVFLLLPARKDRITMVVFSIIGIAGAATAAFALSGHLPREASLSGGLAALPFIFIHHRWQELQKPPEPSLGSFECFPKEILELIASHLTLRELATLGLVCRRFQQISDHLIAKKIEGWRETFPRKIFSQPPTTKLRNECDFSSTRLLFFNNEKYIFESQQGVNVYDLELKRSYRVLTDVSFLCEITCADATSVTGIVNSGTGYELRRYGDGVLSYSYLLPKNCDRPHLSVSEGTMLLFYRIAAGKYDVLRWKLKDLTKESTPKAVTIGGFEGNLPVKMETCGEGFFLLTSPDAYTIVYDGGGRPILKTKMLNFHHAAVAALDNHLFINNIIYRRDEGGRYCLRQTLEESSTLTCQRPYRNFLFRLDQRGGLSILRLDSEGNYRDEATFRLPGQQGMSIFNSVEVSGAQILLKEVIYPSEEFHILGF